LNETEAGVGLDGIVVGKSVPPSVGLAKERASNRIPVCLGVGSIGNSEVGSRAAYRPSGLSDPDWLSTNSSLCGTESILEETWAVLDAVGLGGLEVWVGVHSNPIASIDDGLVRAVDPSSPGVDVTDGGSAQGSIGNGGTNLANV
jgi:hypothetical protein